MKGGKMRDRNKFSEIFDNLCSPQKYIYYSLLVNPEKEEFGRIQMIPWHDNFQMPKEGDKISVPGHKGKFIVISVTKGKEPWSGGVIRSFTSINVKQESNSPAAWSLIKRLFLLFDMMSNYLLG